MAKYSICSIPDCGKTARGLGFCNAHYLRLKRHGDPLKTVKASNGEVQEYYLNSVITYEGKDCLIWPYAKINGYGNMARNGRTGFVSRFLCEDINGPPPTSKHQAAHTCGKGHLGCVTKAHMVWKTRKENEKDKLLHGTHNRGENHSSSKITNEQGLEILSLKGLEPLSVTADKFGLAKSTVCQIQNGKRWAWLSPE